MHSIDYSFMTPGSLPPECEQSLQQQAATSLNEFVHEVVGASLACEIVLSVGSPTLEIINCALENEADLIVMGTHGRSGFERFMLGSITEKLVRKAQCPVLAVRQLSYAPIEPAFPAVSLDYKTVLVPVDLTEHSAQTMSYAKWLALQCGARLNVIYVMERTVSPIVDPSYSTILVDYWKDVQAEAARMLEELVAPALQEGVLAEHCIVHGK
jgi:nucleotide-binding universal stress UspA family protein